MWDREVSVLHTRDLDSLPTINEYKFIKYFESSSCSVGTIRSHENHHGIACRMLAGLSSFKPNLITPNIKGFNFDMYYTNSENSYGSDQKLMIKTFASNEKFTKDYFLDCKIDNQNNEQNFPCHRSSINLVETPEKIINLFDSIKKETNVSWLGQPCDSRGYLLKLILQQTTGYYDKIKQNKYIKEFYKV